MNPHRTTIEVHGNARLWTGFLTLAIHFLMCVTMPAPEVWAQLERPTFNAITVADKDHQESAIRFKASPQIKGNVVHLGDLVEFSGAIASTEDLSELPLAPAPAQGVTQTWTRTDVLNHLQLRGVSVANVQWRGAESVIVKPPAKTESELGEFRPAFVNGRLRQQAEKNVIDAIQQYIQLRTGDSVIHKIKAQFPEKYIDIFSRRKTIRSITGGTPPWTGTQELDLQVADQGEIQIVRVSAQIEMPDMVVVASKTLRRGQILTLAEVRLEPIDPRWNTRSLGDYIDSPDKVVGLQLRKALNAGQPLLPEDVGPPIVVNKDDIIEIEVTAGDFIVKTTGRSLGFGSIGQMIVVEILEQRKKIAGVVAGPGLIRVTADTKPFAIPMPTEQVAVQADSGQVKRVR